MIIESTKNETVKRTRFLSERKGRAEMGMHFIEGEKLVREAILAGAEICNAFIEEGHDELYQQLSDCGARVYTVSRMVMKSLTNTGEPQFICASVKTPDMKAPDVYQKGLIVVLDEVQDPGNMGTIIRTADAFGAKGVLINSGCADVYSPKVVRSTMGSIYHLPIWNGDIENEFCKMKQQGFDFICGHLYGSEVMPEFNKNSVALVIGNEGHGVSEKVASLCKKYRLHMYGKAESLNASVAAGILIYELSKIINA